jgi:hypothetical protein
LVRYYGREERDERRRFPRQSTRETGRARAGVPKGTLPIPGFHERAIYLMDSVWHAWITNRSTEEAGAVASSKHPSSLISLSLGFDPEKTSREPFVRRLHTGRRLCERQDSTLLDPTPAVPHLPVSPKSSHNCRHLGGPSESRGTRQSTWLLAAHHSPDRPGLTTAHQQRSFSLDPGGRRSDLRPYHTRRSRNTKQAARKTFQHPRVHGMNSISCMARGSAGAGGSRR